MNRVKRLIHIDYANKLGLDGENVTIAVMDTGIVRHPDFENRIIGFKDFCNQRRDVYDDNGHGTHVNDLKNNREKWIKQVNER